MSQRDRRGYTRSRTSDPRNTRYSRVRGLLLANGAVLFFGLAGVLGKMSMLPSPLIVFGRVFFATLTLAIVVLFRRVPLRPRNTRDALLLVGQGALLALHWTAFFQAINVSNVAIGLLSFSCFPLFTALLEPLILRQRPGRLHVLASLLVLPGIYLLVPTFSLHDQITLGVAWGILAGATFALLSVVNRLLGRSYPSLTISFYQDGIAALVLLPALLLSASAQLWQPQELLILLLLGVVCTALAHTLFIASLRQITAQSASLIATLEPVWGIAFSALLLYEQPTIRTLLGGIIILCATLIPVLIAALPSNRPTHPTSL
ncbi:membrane protein [Ktedonobacteria bacterium brp13]|nr:membrane protein [Ktedonobacteria bacterium brp13]